MQRIHVTRQYFETSGPRDHFFEKTKKPVSGYGLGECLYRISGLYRFPFGQELPYRPTNLQTSENRIFTSENRNILDRMLTSRGFWFKSGGYTLFSMILLKTMDIVITWPTYQLHQWGKSNYSPCNHWNMHMFDDHSTYDYQDNPYLINISLLVLLKVEII